MKHIGVLFVLIVGVACVSNQKEQQDEAVILKAQGLVRGDDVGLSFDNGEKWVIDSATMEKLYIMRNKVNEMGHNLDNLQLGQFNRFGVDLKAYETAIPTTVGDHRHPQVEILLAACDTQIELLRGNDLQQAQTAIVSLSYILDEVNNYFILQQ